ncbi:MAG: S-methyl-5'-thioadenosine phosphorylase [Thermodesulfovibrionales bacterium]
MPSIGVIGGSGLYDMPGAEIVESRRIATPYGEPSDSYRIGRCSGVDVAFLPRHGASHGIPPHKVNYRANLWGMRELGVSRVVSVGATGAVSGLAKPGEIVVLDQVIDLTSGREATFFDGGEVVHVDFTEPFCPDLRRRLYEASCRTDVAVITHGTYLCVNGPRLETAAEIRAFGSLGADVVGMTLMPEAVLARELELCLAGIAVVTNFAAGISSARLTAQEVMDGMKRSTGMLRDLLAAFFSLPVEDRDCSCGGSLGQARV